MLTLVMPAAFCCRYWHYVEKVQEAVVEVQEQLLALQSEQEIGPEAESALSFQLALLPLPGRLIKFGIAVQSFTYLPNFHSAASDIIFNDAKSTAAHLALSQSQPQFTQPQSAQALTKSKSSDRAP